MASATNGRTHDQSGIEPVAAIEKAPGALAPQAGRSADIMELVMADHRRIRRLREALQDVARTAGDSGSAWLPAYVWQRFSGLLMAHFDAEEEICYLPMFMACPYPATRWRDAIADHEDIREDIREASLQRACSPQWWRAVSAALTASAEHLDREEASILADCLPRLTSSRRRALGRQWVAFTGAWAGDSTYRIFRGT